MKKRLVVGISGGSGIPLATELLSQLQKSKRSKRILYTREVQRLPQRRNRNCRWKKSARWQTLFMTIRISVRRLRARDGGAPPRSEAAERVYDTIKKPLDGEISTEDFLCLAASENFVRQDVFLPVLPQSVVYYRKCAGKWAAKAILERGNRV